MESNAIFSVIVTGAENAVREFTSDCVLVLAHKLDSDDFDMSLNSSASGKTMFMLLQAIDQAKQQILDGDAELKKIYNVSQAILAEEE